MVNFLQCVTFAVVKIVRHILLAVLLAVVPLGASAQNHVRRAMEKARERQEAMARAQVASEQGKGSGGNMRMVVKDGDTTYLDRLPAVYILSRSKRTTEPTSSGASITSWCGGSPACTRMRRHRAY